MQGVKISSLNFILPSFSGNSRLLDLSFVEHVTVLGILTSGETVKLEIADKSQTAARF